MEVRFRTKRLEDIYFDDRKAHKELGAELAGRYASRVYLLVQAASFADVIGIKSLRCHRLKGDRAGEWAIKLDGFHRLIVTLESGPPEIVEIEEISKHYGD